MCVCVSSVSRALSQKCFTLKIWGLALSVLPFRLSPTLLQRKAPWFVGGHLVSIFYGGGFEEGVHTKGVMQPHAS